MKEIFHESLNIDKIFSIIFYILLLGIMFFILFVRLYFTSTTLVKEVQSPNNKAVLEMYLIDEGALGGSFKLELAEKYFNIFKKNKTIYLGDYIESDDVKWLENNHIEVKGKIMDLEKL